MGKENDGSTVTEQDLLKSLQDLEGKKPDEPAKADAVKVATTDLTKSVADTIKDKASEDLKKSLNVSSALKEFTDLVGVHVDTSLKALEKSLQGAAERDLSVISILGQFKKSIDSIGEKVEQFGNKPAGDAKSKTSTTADDVLKKSTDKGGEKTAEDKAIELKGLRKSILAGCEELAKSATSIQEKEEWAKVGIMFESSNKITDANMHKALKAVGKLPTA